MFEAFILVCMINHPSMCTVMQDMWGPYRTKIECISRIDKMKRDILSLSEVTYLAPRDSMCREKEST